MNSTIPPEGNTPPEDNPDFKNATFDAAADNAVVKYAEAIRDWIYESDGLKIGTVSLLEDFVANSDRSLLARQYTVRADMGAVVVLPNFTQKAPASACVLNVGLVQGMISEGYSLKYIQENGKIYGNLMPHTEKNVELFGYYLTHKVKE